MLQKLKKNWFMIGLLGTTAATVADSSGLLVIPGLWLKEHNGPDSIIILIFFFSGLALNTSQIRAGFKDYIGTITALFLIFIISPLLALLFSMLPLSTGLLLGLFLVAVMPCTLSSGVVMTDAAGGNMAHALLITIVSNSLAVVTIPLSLALLLSFTGDTRVIEVDQLPIMIKIATLVLLPLIVGILVRNRMTDTVRPLLPYTSILNQVGILIVVWMATCKGREAIVDSLDAIAPVLGVTFFFHLAIMTAGLLLVRAFTIEKGRRESVILMGGQKTLPLSLILQVSLFPEYGIALVVCVLHHIIHLAMDSFLVQYLKKKE
ncbi:bile acid:sodium symporter [Desulfopila sp. IMCC35008]|uniref:bile acid:sodium symporter n=1 Tax=Desulfopila sp. IMCC35008 TaxID=2653858 RepID=UPI0013D634AB|nr:bile acid:sodium symporter [Desulfopila sp. IMCC35008]